jgi:nucleoside-diphosphate-sugar epimerase
MIIGVTGATGFIGTRLVQELMQRGHSVRGLSRRKVNSESSAPNLTFVRGGVENLEALRELTQSTECVIHLAAFVHQETTSDEEKRRCYSVNVSGTKNLLQAMKLSERRQHLVFLSTVAVYGSSFSEATENRPCLPATAYAQSKLDAERSILEAVEQGTITACILRPSMVFGPRAPGNLKKMVRLIRLGVMPVISKGRNLKSLVQVDDLIAIILNVMNDPERFNRRIYNVAADPPLSILQIGEALARGVGRNPWMLPLKSWMLRGSAAVLKNVNHLSRRKIPDPSRAFQTFVSSATVNTSALQRDLGHPFRSTEKALEEAASSYGNSS